MRRLAWMLAPIVLVAACGGDTQLPDPTGKASVRAINAVPRSPAVEFLIEERTIGALDYKAISGNVRYDDFTYNFNFDVRFAGDSTDTRIATTAIDFEPDQEYLLFLSGTIANPVVSVVESAERNFDTAATVFQARFAHMAASLGDLDIYLLAPGTVPTSGMAAASLSSGEVSVAADFEGGDYVVFITTANDPADILFESQTTTIVAQSNLVIAPFDGNENDLEPLVVRGLTAAGGSIPFVGTGLGASVEFLHAAIDLGSSDIYADEALTEQLVAAHDYGELTASVAAEPGEGTLRYTPAGSTAAVTLETAVNFAAGVRYRAVAVGANGTYNGGSLILDRSRVDTSARLQVFHASQNFAFLNIYALQDGETVDDTLPRFNGLVAGTAPPPSALPPGQYDLVVTTSGETDILAGPLPIDVALGDRVDIAVFDTADPAILDIRRLDTP